MYVSLCITIRYTIHFVMCRRTNQVFTPILCCFGHTSYILSNLRHSTFSSSHTKHDIMLHSKICAAPTAANPAYILAAEQRTLDLNAGICFTTEPLVVLIGPPFAVSNSKSFPSPKFHKWLKSWSLKWHVVRTVSNKLRPVNPLISKLVHMTSHQEAKLLSNFMTVTQAPSYWQAQ